MSNQIGKLTGLYISQFYPDEIRKVVYYDKETNRAFVYLTNIKELTSEQIEKSPIGELLFNADKNNVKELLSELQINQIAHGR